MIPEEHVLQLGTKESDLLFSNIIFQKVISVVEMKVVTSKAQENLWNTGED